MSAVSKAILFYRKKLLKEFGEWKTKQKRRESFLNALITSIKKDPTPAIRKPSDELKFHEKTMMTAIKQVSNLDINPVYYAIWGVLENKNKYAISLQIIGSLKRAIEEECKKMSEEFILKASKSFQKWRSYWVNLLVCVSHFNLFFIV